MSFFLLLNISHSYIFPPLGILAEHALQITMSSSATEKNFLTGEDMFTNDDTIWESLQFNAAVTYLQSESGWISDKSDWLIDLLMYFIGPRYQISFIYRSNKSDAIFTHIGR